MSGISVVILLRRKLENEDLQWNSVLQITNRYEESDAPYGMQYHVIRPRAAIASKTCVLVIGSEGLE